MAAIVGKKLKEINELGKYPNIEYLEWHLQPYWILEVAEKELGKGKLTAKEISDLLFEGFKIHIPPIRIIRAFSRAGDKIRPTRGKNVVYYQITSEGKKILYGSQLLPSAESQKLFKSIKELGGRFKNDYRELSICYGSSCGNATAFLMRKILEKTIFFVFANNKRISKLKDGQGNFLGLQEMLKVAMKEKIGGVPCLMPKTYKKVQGIKFLGDVAAHDFSADVDINDIREQLPYIIVAIKELSSRL